MGRLARRIVCAGAVIATQLLAPAQPAVAVPGIQVVISTTPGGPPETTVLLPIRTQDTAGTVTLFVREVDGEASSEVVLYASPPAGMSISLARPGGQAPAAAVSVDLPANGSIDVAVTATWDDYGAAAVPLLARVDAQVSVVGTLNVERPGGPALTVVGATATGLALSSSGPTLKSGITVATGSRSAEGVVANVSSLLDSASGTRYPVTKPSTEVGALASNSTALVPLNAELPYTGTFTGTLSLTHDGVTDSPVALTITRTLAASKVTIDAVQASSSSFDGRPSTVSVTRAVVLDNSLSGEEATLATPVLVKPSSKVGDDAVPNDPNVKVAKTEVSPAQPGCSIADDAIKIAAGQLCRLAVTLEMPGDPGQYDGTLRFSQPGAVPPDAAVTVQLRRGLPTAVVVILIGLVIGYFISKVLRNRRAKLDRLAQVARISRALDERVAGLPNSLQDDQEQHTYDQLRNQLASMASDASGGAAPADAVISDRLEIIGLQVPVFVPWVMLRRAVLAAPDEVRAALTEDLDAIGRALGAPIAKPEAQALTGDVQALHTKLREKRSTAVRNEIERTKAEVGRMFPADVRQPIDAELDVAESFVASGEGAPEEALAALKRSRSMVIDAMKIRLGGFLADIAPPFGMADTEWASLRRAVQHDVDGVDVTTPETAVLALRDADRRLIGGIVDAAHTKVSQLSRNIPDPPSPQDTARANASDAILLDLKAARAALASGDLAAAHHSYNQARVNFTNPPRGVSFLGPQGAPLSAPELPGALDPATDVDVLVPTVTVTAVPTLAEVQRKWRWYEVVLAVVTIVVGVAVGLVALYVGKPTWGSLGDILLALLWGAGLYQVTGALEGFTGVRTALSS